MGEKVKEIGGLLVVVVMDFSKREICECWLSDLEVMFGDSESVNDVDKENY